MTEIRTIQTMQTDAVAPAAYARRFDAVLAYIDANLDGDLSVDVLSRIAHFSKFHFSTPPSQGSK
ncbi:hypothetical protein EOS_03300 [Caballeronia mineralivorans PML1(12)]|uniref:AraC family transcriptional regulator n=1 Tax=Caballeronia mineralivorans PML1(12) TaxID=908627 RepID=A0A0J1G614_9BURK|nr:hypothetical protein EOS_03300 [Caballeronia mineralivorans PML1(12)]